MKEETAYLSILAWWEEISLLNESEEALIHQFLISQWKSPVKGDWCTLVQKDLEDLDIELSLEEIRNTPKEELKIFLSEIVKEKAFQYLMEKKELHSKMKNLKYERLELQKYLKPDSQLTKTEINFTIAARGTLVGGSARSAIWHRPVARLTRISSGAHHFAIATLGTHVVVTALSAS